MPRPVPLLLPIPRRALSRRDLVPALVYRALRPARTDMAKVVECFTLCDDELGFARALLDKRSQNHLFRSNQRAFCGDFVVVDVSSPEIERRRAVVLDLKQGASLRLGGGGAGVQLRNADQAVKDLARTTGVVADEAPFEVVTGDSREVLAFFGVMSP